MQGRLGSSCPLRQRSSCAVVSGGGEGGGSGEGVGGGAGGEWGGGCGREVGWQLRELRVGVLRAAGRSNGCTEETERSLGQEVPARFGHGCSAQHCSRVSRPEKMESLSCQAGWPANRKWSTGNCALAHAGWRVRTTRPREKRRQGCRRYRALG